MAEIFNFNNKSIFIGNNLKEPVFHMDVIFFCNDVDKNGLLKTHLFNIKRD
jgi:hypothetical protein